MVPVMDGPEFTRRWRTRELSGQVPRGREGCRQKIIGMSANNDSPDVEVTTAELVAM